MKIKSIIYLCIILLVIPKPHDATAMDFTALKQRITRKKIAPTNPQAPTPPPTTPHKSPSIELPPSGVAAAAATPPTHISATAAAAAALSDTQEEPLPLAREEVLILCNEPVGDDFRKVLILNLFDVVQDIVDELINAGAHCVFAIRPHQNDLILLRHCMEKFSEKEYVEGTHYSVHLLFEEPRDKKDKEFYTLFQLCREDVVKYLNEHHGAMSTENRDKVLPVLEKEIAWLRKRALPSEAMLARHRHGSTIMINHHTRTYGQRLQVYKYGGDLEKSHIAHALQEHNDSDIPLHNLLRTIWVQDSWGGLARVAGDSQWARGPESDHARLTRKLSPLYAHESKQLQKPVSGAGPGPG